MIVSAEDEGHIFALAVLAKQMGFRYTIFRESDLKNSLTAIALGPEARCLVKKLPLAFRVSDRAA